MKKSLLILVTLTILFKVILNLTDYKIANGYVEYATMFIIGFGVFYFFLNLDVPKWLKILTTVVALAGIWILGFGVFVLISMGREEVKVINKWNIERYEIKLTSRLGFAGPTYYRYDIYKLGLQGLIYRDIDQAVIPYDSINNCVIKFPETKLTFNKCESEIYTLIK